MRRRRLIGVYRGLLKSIEMPWLHLSFQGPRRRNGRHSILLESDANPVHTQNLSDRSGQYNRHKPTSFDAQPTTFVAVKRRWIDLTLPACCVTRAESLASRKVDAVNKEGDMTTFDK